MTDGIPQPPGSAPAAVTPGHLRALTLLVDEPARDRSVLVADGAGTLAVVEVCTRAAALLSTFERGAA
ncbi:hypothetical protein ACFVIM_22940 [Streptomyces sp. NPDC057638]|uniref:hypothetical protein n=1 Tax=Streptomyces sp. NPDC057638 TaxID=3346190 RepID=UPI0036B837F3